MGEIKGPDFYRKLYSVDAVHYADEIASVLKGLQPPALHVLHGRNTDRQVPADLGQLYVTCNKCLLWQLLTFCYKRVSF